MTGRMRPAFGGLARSGLRRLFSVRALRPRHRTKRGSALVLALLAATSGVLLGLSKVKVETGIKAFLPAHDPSVTELAQKERAFGADPVVVLLESANAGALLDADHLVAEGQLEGRLARLPNVAAVYGPATALNQIAGQAQDFLAELSGRRDGLAAAAAAQARRSGGSDAAAAEAARRATEEFDARYGPLMVQAMPAGLPTLTNQRFVQSVLFTDRGEVKPQWRFVVPSPKSVAIVIRPRQDMDALATRTLVQDVRRTVEGKNTAAHAITISGVPAVASALSDELSREVPVLGAVAVVAVGACFAFIPWTRRGQRLRPVGTTLAAVLVTLSVFGWVHRPLSLGVVAFLSVLLGLGSYYPTYFGQGARRRVVLTVALGSAASFATLILSPLPFVQDIGLTLSLGVLSSAVIGLLLSNRLQPTSEIAMTPSSHASRARQMRWLIVGASTLAVLLAAVGWTMLPRMAIKANVEDFAQGLHAMADARHVQGVMGFSGEVDLVLDGSDVTSPEALAWSRHAQNLIVTELGDHMRPVMSLPSLLTFLGDTPTAEQIDSAVRLLPGYLSSAVLGTDGTVATAIFGVSVDDVSALQTLREQVLTLLPAPPNGYRVHLTGLPMVAVRGEQLVADGRVTANVLGILAAGSVLALGLRRRADALRGIATATLSTGVGLGLLWLTHTPLSPVTVGLGPLTAAVGCEFTVLLAEASRRQTRGLRLSVLLATLSSAIGYAVLLTSRLPAIREFGLMLAGAVVLALGVSWCVVAVSSPRRFEGVGDVPVSVETNELVGAV